MANDTITYDGEKFKTKFQRIDYLIAEEILNGTNESAYNVLVMFGDVNLIPVLRYTTIKEIAKFYGVSEDYLKSVFRRNGITPKKMPTEAKLMSDWSVSEALYGKVKSSYSCYKTGNLCITEMNGNKTSILANKGTFCVYSPKVFLAAAALMYYGRCIKEDSVAQKVIKVLEKCDYGIRAKQTFDKIVEEQYKKRKQEQNALATEAKALQAANQNEQPSVNCNIMISVDVFKMLINSAVKDAVREIVLNYTKN